MKIIEKIKDLYYLLGFGKDQSIGKEPPCQSCGACCNYYKITFTEKQNQQVPKNLIIKINNKTSAMIGANKFKGKCSGFAGEIGRSCACTIYESRPDVCRAFPVFLRNGKQNPKCFKARVYHGLKGEI